MCVYVCVGGCMRACVCEQIIIGWQPTPGPTDCLKVLFDIFLKEHTPDLLSMSHMLAHII